PPVSFASSPSLRPASLCLLVCQQTGEFRTGHRTMDQSHHQPLTTDITQHASIAATNGTLRGSPSYSNCLHQIIAFKTSAPLYD
uniref:Secreted protein n=1 Tax=Macrostomum lignano TaxID=282301 RepID=A0A1I8FC35_9PLAT